MGVPEVFLGCEIKRAADKKSITISCSKYIERMAKRFGLLNCRPVQTPMDHDTVLTIDDLSSKGDSRVESTAYRAYIGSLLYASMTCRPDISYAVKELSRFCVEPLNAHLEAAKRVVRYLYHSRSLGIKYSMQESENIGRFSIKQVYNDHRPNEVMGYTDADWAKQLPGRKSKLLNENALLPQKLQRRRYTFISSWLR
jgi:hypothetical protein